MHPWLRPVLNRLRAHLACQSRAHLVDALLVAQKEGLAAERKVFDLARRLDLRIWMDIKSRQHRDELQGQVRHWIERTEHAERVAAEALADREEAIGRVLYLEKELEDLTRSRDELIGIADGLRAELKLPRSGVTTTVARGKGRR